MASYIVTGAANMNAFPCDWSPDRADLDLANGNTVYWPNGTSANQGPINWVRSRTANQNVNYVTEKMTHNKVKVKVSNKTYVVTLRNKEQNGENNKTERSPIRDIFRRFSLRYRRKKTEKDCGRPRPCKYTFPIIKVNDFNLSKTAYLDANTNF